MATAAALVTCFGCGGSAAEPVRASELPAPDAPEQSVPVPGAPEGPDRSGSSEPADEPTAGTPDPVLEGRDCVPDDLNAAVVGGSFTVDRQSKLNRLAGCRRILGSLYVSSDSQLDLTALSSLRVVDGALNIVPARYDAPVVRRQSLVGLEGLQAVGSLVLVSIEGGLGPLSGLQAVGSLVLDGIEGGLGPLSGISGEVASVSLGHIPGLRDLQPLAGFTITQNLDLTFLPDLESLAGASLAPILEGLSISSNPLLETLSGLDGVRELGRLSVSEEPRLRSLSLPEGVVSLREVSISSCPQLTSSSEISRFTMIESLSVSDMPNLLDLGGGSPASSLQRLWVGGCPRLTEIAPVGGLSSLREVGIHDCDGLTEVDGLAASAALTTLSIADNAALTHLPSFEQIAGEMEFVYIANNLALVAGPTFPHVQTLHRQEALIYEMAELWIVGNPLLQQLDGFPELRSASMVTIENNAALSDVALPNLASLSYLRVRENASLSRLELGIEQKLQSVQLVNNPTLDELTLGAPTDQLTRLELHGNSSLTSELQQHLLDLTGPDTLLTLE